MTSHFALPCALTLTLLGGCANDGSGNSAGMDTFGGDGPGNDDDRCATRLAQKISNNHGHVLEVDLDQDVQAGDIITLGGRGASHSHAVNVDSGRLQQLVEGQSVTVETSSSSLHTHRVTTSLVTPCDGPGLDDGFPTPTSG